MFRQKRRKRTIITPEQLTKLEDLYKHEQWPGRERKEDLARDIEMSTHFVNIWFQNKRSRMKKIEQENKELQAMMCRGADSPRGTEDVASGAASISNNVRDRHTSSMSSVIQSTSLAAAGAQHPASPSLQHVTAYLPRPSAVRPLKPLTGVLPLVATTAAVVTPICVGTNPASPIVSRLARFSVPIVSQTRPTIVIKPTHHLSNTACSSGAVSLLSASPKKAHNVNGVSDQAAGFTKTSNGLNLNTPGGSTIRPNSQNGPQSQHLSTSQRSSRACDVDGQQPSEGSDTPADGPKSQKSPLHCTFQSASPFKTKVSHNELRQTPTTLLRCLALMMAITDSPGLVKPDSPEFDLAVTAALYGVRLAKGSVLRYDHQEGFRFHRTLKKAKKKGSKKKRRHKSRVKK